jgi:hypothetical protein
MRKNLDEIRHRELTANTIEQQGGKKRDNQGPPTEDNRPSFF